MAFVPFFLAAYLFGSVPFGLLIGKWVKGIDIREHGSKNIGTTNVFRVIGKSWGLLVFILDALKGYLAVQMPSYLNQPTTLAASIFLAVLAVLGHAFPVWLRFKGGKGVATSLGVFLAVAPAPTFLAFLLWCAVFGFTHIVSISSLSAAFGFPILVFFTYHKNPDFNFLLLASLVLTAFIFFTHRGNILRIFRREEKTLF